MQCIMHKVKTDCIPAKREAYPITDATFAFLLPPQSILKNTKWLGARETKLGGWEGAETRRGRRNCSPPSTPWSALRKQHRTRDAPGTLK